MKKKELKNLAKKIAKYESIIQTSDDKDEIRKAQLAIIELSGSVDSLEDITAIDEMVQDFLKYELDISKIFCYNVYISQKIN